MLLSSLSKRQRKRLRDQERWRIASGVGAGGTDHTLVAREYCRGQSGLRSRKSRYLSALGRSWKGWKRLSGGAESMDRGRRFRFARCLRAWFTYVRSGGFAKAEIIDEEEGLFRSMDPTPLERRNKRESLRVFLLRGQSTWSKDGGVKVRPKKEDPRLKALWPYIWRARKRRPTGVVSVKEDVREHVGTFWSLQDFEGADREVYEVLLETKRAEEEQVRHFRAHGTFSGDKIDVEGCRELGVPEDKLEELREGVCFDFDESLPAYSPMWGKAACETGGKRMLEYTQIFVWTQGMMHHDVAKRCETPPFFCDPVRVPFSLALPARAQIWACSKNQWHI